MIKQFVIFHYKYIKIDLQRYLNNYTEKFMCRTDKWRRFKRKVKEGIYFTFKLLMNEKSFAELNCKSQILNP